MKRQKEIEAAFKTVREIIFPQWDRKGEWKVFYDPDLPSFGECLSKKKMIIIGWVYKDSEDIKTLLVHEICHSSIDGHNKRFFTRMLKAADRADKAGWSNVADLIRKDVKSYENSIRPNALYIYEQIEDYLIENYPDASYETVITYVARSNGIYPEELKKSFKRCREVYDKASRFWQKNPVPNSRGHHGNKKSRQIFSKAS